MSTGYLAGCALAFITLLICAFSNIDEETSFLEIVTDILISAIFSLLSWALLVIPIAGWLLEYFSDKNDTQNY